MQNYWIGVGGEDDSAEASREKGERIERNNITAIGCCEYVV
jgi:hypothetical protein